MNVIVKSSRNIDSNTITMLLSQKWILGKSSGIGWTAYFVAPTCTDIRRIDKIIGKNTPYLLFQSSQYDLTLCIPN